MDKNDLAESLAQMRAGLVTPALTQAEEERAHYQGVIRVYRDLIRSIKEGMADPAFDGITQRQSREIIRTLSRAQRDAEDGVELWTDET